MDVGECVVSAGRAVLDMAQREWQPLSPGELEQRLDQAVEEVLEAELMARLDAEPPPTRGCGRAPRSPVCVEPRGPQGCISPAEEETPEPGAPWESESGAAVKVSCPLFSRRAQKRKMIINLKKCYNYNNIPTGYECLNKMNK